MRATPIVSTWVYVLLAVESGGHSIGDVLRNSLLLSDGEARVTHPSHVRVHLDELERRALVVSHDIVEERRRRIEWRITSEGQAELQRIRARTLNVAKGLAA